MKFIFANCVICKCDVFNEDDLIAFQRTDPPKFVNLENQQPWTGIYCICLQCVCAITQVTEKVNKEVNKEVFSAFEIPPEVEEMFEAMKKQFYVNREKYRVKSFEALCKKMLKSYG